MIKIEKTEVYGWEAAIRGMRNPKNSWERSDSVMCEDTDAVCDGCPHNNICGCTLGDCEKTYIIGPNDHGLMMNLAAGGPVHAKYRRMITVYVDITAPLYWWKEFDTYKIGTVANSCSTMHKIDAKEFDRNDFSWDHLLVDDLIEEPEDSLVSLPVHVLDITIETLNHYRKKLLEAKTKPMKDESKRAELMKKYWLQLIQLLPSSYNQKRTIMLNYEVLAGIYPMRKNHKLDEWHVFCDWIKSLPYSEIIVGAEKIGE